MTRYAQRTLIGQPGLANWGKAAAGGIGVVQGYGVATGGTSTSITDTVAYTLLTFTSDDNLVVSTGGLFDICLVGGGGGAGTTAADFEQGGGGGGQVLVLVVANHCRRQESKKDTVAVR